MKTFPTTSHSTRLSGANADLGRLPILASESVTFDDSHAIELCYSGATITIIDPDCPIGTANAKARRNIANILRELLEMLHRRDEQPHDETLDRPEYADYLCGILIAQYSALSVDL